MATTPQFLDALASHTYPLQGVTLDLSDIAATVTASGALRLTLIWPVP